MELWRQFFLYKARLSDEQLNIYGLSETVYCVQV